MTTEYASIFPKIKMLLPGKRLNVTDEKMLQDQINFILGMCPALPKAKREYSLGELGRVDFFIEGAAIEVKIKGSAMAIYRQLLKYAEHEEVKEIILITGKTMSLPAAINGKPANLINIAQSWL